MHGMQQWKLEEIGAPSEKKLYTDIHAENDEFYR
jgi:hypothetical protein